MATAQERYEAAVRYVDRAIAAVERGPIVFDPLSMLAEGYAGRLKTEPFRDDRHRIEARWLRATTDGERSAVARDAELLADRVEQNLPGAPQDRARTDLAPGETSTSTPATSFADELETEAHSVWTKVRDGAHAATDGAKKVGTWLLVGGGLLLGIRAVGLLRDRQRRNRRRPPGRRLINRRLVEAVDRSERGSAGG